MARFRAEIRGRRGMASRLGGAKSGIWTRTQSFTGDIYVEMRAVEPEGENEEDWCRITAAPHGTGGHIHILYNGPVATLVENGLHGLMGEYAQRALATTKEDVS